MEKPAITPNEVGVESAVTLQPLSDEWLIDTYGHLEPQEVLTLATTAQCKARLAQLQLNALRSIGDSDSEWTRWLACYHQACGTSDDYS